MTSRQAKLQEDTSFRVTRILQKEAGLTQRKLAEKLGISVVGLNYCLKALIEKGVVKMRNFKDFKNKFGYIDVLTPAGVVRIAAIANSLLNRKIKEYDALKDEIDLLKAEISKDALV